ncbi:MAG: hypothetical protein HC884_12105 [Chloroflexaceae bacterium]|nr:hypothetical protein [Chloroflexaceae bacterium]
MSNHLTGQGNHRRAETPNPASDRRTVISAASHSLWAADDARRGIRVVLRPPAEQKKVMDHNAVGHARSSG